ncbi:hypothetical protein Ciccas_012497 [Cichlidogyrus casuarinus]|uniref:Kinesin motor domain-containing protein n=1 Tax=Cichlidogyrus casuarinus TaxID=1844966 RepID=A0ABD2PN66_9PLAT
MTFGATGTGKTYTMCGNQSTEGLITLSLQVYNEKIRDLLAAESVGPLRLRDHPRDGIFIESESCVLTSSKV